MKFPRNIRPIGSQLDAAPFAAMFFLVLILVALRGHLLFTPGVPIDLPEAVGLPGTTNPTVVVVVDAAGQLFYENQIIDEPSLRRQLIQEVRQSGEPLTLVVQAHKDTRYEAVVRLSLLAREAGISEALLATRPSHAGSSGAAPRP